MTLHEARRRDRILRAFLTERDWDLDAEATLVRHLVLHSQELLPDAPLLVGWEWPSATGSRGDLLFLSADGVSLTVVEVKALGGKHRNKGRNVVERQAVEFAEQARALFARDQVHALVYTSDEWSAGVGPRAATRASRFA